MEFCKNCKIIDKNISVQAIERLFDATNQSQNNLKKSQDKELHRYEFVEILIRLAMAKFKQTKIELNPVKAVDKLLAENIYPNAMELNGE